MELQSEGPLIGQYQMDLFVSWVFMFSPSDPFFNMRLKGSLKLVILL